jgi:hypothetical protein
MLSDWRDQNHEGVPYSFKILPKKCLLMTFPQCKHAAMLASSRLDFHQGWSTFGGVNGTKRTYFPTGVLRTTQQKADIYLLNSVLDHEL